MTTRPESNSVSPLTHGQPLDCSRIVRCCCMLSAVLVHGCLPGAEENAPGTLQPVDRAFHVYNGEEIQPALDAAAQHETKRVVVHAGTYRPRRHGQALVWFNAQHNGITLEADGNVVLRADNPDIADPDADSFPAVVNHVVYFGDGVGPETVLRGFRITGANGFVTRDESQPIQPETGLEQLAKVDFFYTDGGGIKIFGRSFPRIENVDVVNNFARPCGGGVSVEHRGLNLKTVVFENCIFRENRCQLTGAGVDVLPQSSARFVNCLFLNNVGNLGEDDVSPDGRSYNAEHGSGALTVFPESEVSVERCTFTGNWNGVDDKGRGNVYRDCIFWQNDRSGGLSPGDRYELDILSGIRVENCFINGTINDLRGTIDAQRNRLDAEDPQFDERYVPQARSYSNVGYRPSVASLLDFPVRQVDSSDNAADAEDALHSTP